MSSKITFNDLRKEILSEVCECNGHVCIPVLNQAVRTAWADNVNPDVPVMPSVRDAIKRDAHTAYTCAVVEYS